MKITNNREATCIVVDIETMKEMFLVGCLNKEMNEQFDFEISKRKNQLFEFVEWYTGNTFDYTVTYNGVAFDCPVLQFVVDNHQEWIDFNNQQIIDLIYRYSQHVIEESNNGRPTYRESSFSKPTIDVFTILGLNNMARYTSLKSCEFALQMPNLQTMPIHHTKTDMTLEEIQMTIDYCNVDLEGTWNVFLLVLGLYKHPLYEDNNQLQLRFDIRDEFKIDCLNYSDIKIGEELMKHSYAKEINKEVKDLPKKGIFRKEIKLKECLPGYIKFESPELQKILKSTKGKVIKQNGNFGYEFMFKGTKYSLLKGGMHSVNSFEKHDSNKTNKIITCDVSSFYPASLIEREIYPEHLGRQILKVYKQKYNQRIELKPQSKTDKRIKGICDGIKYQLNIFFGKLGSMDSWTFDMKALLSVTIGNQFTLLMLIEKLELNGFHVIVANTDGIETIVPRDKENMYYTICKEWETLTNYTLEYDEYKFIYLNSVNDYIAQTINDKWKYKGEFVSDFEINKNSSMRVVPLAIQEYFKNGTHPKDFISSYKNIYDFCIRAKATGDFYLEEVKEDETKIKHNKMLRYYISNNGNLLFKRGFNSKGKVFDGWVNAPIAEIGNPLKITNFNKFVLKEQYDVDHSFYIIKALRILDKLLKKTMLDSYLKSIEKTIQISMFNYENN